MSRFRVDEIATTIALNPKGRSRWQITLTNWETNRFCNNLSKKLCISRNRIFAGTKDKRAATSHVIDAPQFKVAEVEIPDVVIEVLGRTHQKIGFGNHRGNRFTIVVRGCAHPDGTPMSEEEALNEVEQLKADMEEKLGPGRFPNWIGPQRFGSGRAVTAEVGRSVVQHQWEDAVHTYISKKGEHESPEVAAFRQHIRTNGITQEGLDMAPDWLGHERRMTEHLLNNPDDHIGAFRKLPNNLQLMTVHALQSVASTERCGSDSNRESASRSLKQAISLDALMKEGNSLPTIVSWLKNELFHVLEGIVSLADCPSQDHCPDVTFVRAKESLVTLSNRFSLRWV